MKNATLCAMPALLVALAACSKGPSPAEPAGPGQANPASLLSSPKVAPSTQLAGQPPAAGDQTAIQPDAAVPLERYSDLNALPAGMGLSYLVTAKALAPLPDDERLDRLSGSYHAERDVFKRQAIAKAELPRVDAALAEYRRQSYYSLPIANYSDQALALTNISLGAYQPASHSFPLVGYGGRCWGGIVRNQQGAVLRLDGAGPPCSLTVDDETLARAIEAARAGHTLRMAGTAYVFVPQAGQGTAEGSVAAVKIVLTGGASLATLGSFDLRRI